MVMAVNAWRRIWSQEINEPVDLPLSNHSLATIAATKGETI